MTVNHNIEEVVYLLVDIEYSLRSFLKILNEASYHKVPADAIVSILMPHIERLNEACVELSNGVDIDRFIDTELQKQ